MISNANAIYPVTRITVTKPRWLCMECLHYSACGPVQKSSSLLANGHHVSTVCKWPMFRSHLRVLSAYRKCERNLLQAVAGAFENSMLVIF